MERLEVELTRLNERRRGIRGAKGHSRAVCELKAHPVYGRFVRELATGELRIDRQAVRAEERLDGKYLLSTTDPGLSAEDVALGYRQLVEVERAFRTLKRTLELRPLYHRLPERIRSHVLLCWLALLLIRVIENESGRTWGQIRDELERLHQVHLSSKDGSFMVTTELTAEQRNLLKSLNIPPPKKVQALKLTPEQM